MIVFKEHQVLLPSHTASCFYTDIMREAEFNNSHVTQVDSAYNINEYQEDFLGVNASGA
jgi:hypothetical protein